MVGLHHWLNGHGFGWTPGVGDGQGALELVMDREVHGVAKSWTRLSDWTELITYMFLTSFGVDHESENNGSIILIL